MSITRDCINTAHTISYGAKSSPDSFAIARSHEADVRVAVALHFFLDILTW